MLNHGIGCAFCCKAQFPAEGAGCGGMIAMYCDHQSHQALYVADDLLGLLADLWGDLPAFLPAGGMPSARSLNCVTLSGLCPPFQAM